jgi:hypothetical protein
MSDLFNSAKPLSSSGSDERLTSEDLAALIIDALLRADIVKKR